MWSACIVPMPILKALYQVMPDRVLAEGSGAVWTMQIQGKRDDGRAFTSSMFNYSGGMGARATKTGPSATCYPTGVAAVPVEIVEAVTPVVFDRKELRPGSGGEGAMRGGDGQIIQFRLRTKDEWLLNAVREPRRRRARGPGRRRRRARPANSTSTASRCATSRSSPCSRMTSYCSRRREAAVTGIAELKPKQLRGREVMTNKKLAALAALAALLSVTPAGAQEVYKIGISAGLTGYAATVDRGWRDGVEVAAAALNAKGGIMGRKIEVDHRGQQVRASGGGDGLSQDDLSTKPISSFRAASRPEISPARRSRCGRKSRWCSVRSCRRTPTT